MKFTLEELSAILMLIELKLDKLEAVRSIYNEFGEEMPDTIRDQAEKYCSLRNKIVEWIFDVKYQSLRNKSVIEESIDNSVLR